MTIEPENQQVSDADESSLEAEFAARRAARLGGDAEPAAETEPAEAERAESQVQAEANPEPAKTEGDLKPAEPSGTSKVEEDRAARLERELEAERRERLRAQESLKAFQRKVASFERGHGNASADRFNHGGNSKPTPGAKPADSATADHSDLLASPEIKRALADFPEVKPIVDAFARQNANLASDLSEAKRLLQAYAQRLDEEVLPSVNTLASSWEETQFRAKQRDLTSAFADWSKHCLVDVELVVDRQTGETRERPVDVHLSPEFAAWVYRQPPEIAMLRYSDDPDEVKRMWAKFAQDTASAPAPTPAALPQERTQRLAASAAPNVKPSPQPARVNWEDMSPEEQFAYRRKLRKSGAS